MSVIGGTTVRQCDCCRFVAEEPLKGGAAGWVLLYAIAAQRTHDDHYDLCPDCVVELGLGNTIVLLRERKQLEGAT